MQLFVDGIGFWTPALPGWTHARAALRGEPVDVAPQPRAAPALLAGNERRRAPETVLAAIEAGAAAVADAGADGASVASVFASAHGDLGVVDALCATLAANPLLLSPTRFHHSVHNAASGYWSIATGCRAASTAVAAYDHSFAAGFVEAASQVGADGAPVLLVATDGHARGPLASVNTSRGTLAVALLLAPAAGPRTQWQVDWQLDPTASPTPIACDVSRRLAANASADALPLFEALAGGRAATVTLPLGRGPALRLALQVGGA